MSSKNEQCLLTILREADTSLTTSELLHRATQYPDLCQGCSSGSHIITAGMRLLDKGLVSRKVVKGGFEWRLVFER